MKGVEHKFKEIEGQVQKVQVQANSEIVAINSQLANALKAIVDLSLHFREQIEDSTPKLAMRPTFNELAVGFDFEVDAIWDTSSQHAHLFHIDQHAATYKG